MKRLTALVLILALLLCACQSAPTEAAPSTPPTTAAPTTTTAPAEPTALTSEPTEPTEDPADSIRVGYYVLSGYKSEDMEIEGFASASMRIYLQVLPDRTGIFSMNGVIQHVEWTPRYLTISGTTCKFTLEDDTMVLNYFYEAEMTLTYCGEELPDYYRNASLEPGLYLLTDMIEDGEAYYFPDPGMDVGYILLEEDHTGIYSNGEGYHYDLTWRNDAIVVSSTPLTYAFLSADQTEDGIATLVIYSREIYIYRAIDPNESDDF